MWLYRSEYLGKFEYENHECLYHQKTLANINSWAIPLESRVS